MTNVSTRIGVQQCCFCQGKSEMSKPYGISGPIQGKFPREFFAIDVHNTFNSAA